MKVWPEPSRNTAKEISTQLAASHAQAEAGRAVASDGPLILHIVKLEPSDHDYDNKQSHPFSLWLSIYWLDIHPYWPLLILKHKQCDVPFQYLSSIEITFQIEGTAFLLDSIPACGMRLVSGRAPLHRLPRPVFMRPSYYHYLSPGLSQCTSDCSGEPLLSPATHNTTLLKYQTINQANKPHSVPWVVANYRTTGPGRSVWCAKKGTWPFKYKKRDINTYKQGAIFWAFTVLVGWMYGISGTLSESLIKDPWAVYSLVWQLLGQSWQENQGRNQSNIIALSWKVGPWNLCSWLFYFSFVLGPIFFE